ncbi:MAG: right-handed parallel beta-helix repeat-containing protein, partial [Candidatus Woesearchaeota archaeon]
LQGSVSTNIIENNTFTNNTNTGCLLQGTATQNTVKTNTISNSTSGIKLSGNCNNNTILNNTIYNNTIGIRLESNAQNNTIENNTLLTNTQAGIRIDPTAANNTLRNNVLINNLWGLILTGGNLNVIINSTINGTLGSLNISGNGFNNTIINSVLVANSTYEIQNSQAGPTILTYTVDLNIATQRTFRDIINLSYNKVRVNSTAANEFNTSAVITLFNLQVSPSPVVDINDNGTFQYCAWCTIIQSSPGILIFNVSRFTTYSSNDTEVYACNNISNASTSVINGTILHNMTDGDQGGEGLGWAVTAGDFNNDGIKDRVISGPFAPRNQTIPQAGRAYVIYGILPRPTTSGPINTLANITIHGLNAGEHLGWALSAGDLNGDKIDDIAIGIPGNHTVSILFGANRSNLNITREQLNVSINISSTEEVSLAIADLNNDNISDLIIGQPDYPNVSNNSPGRVDILFGRQNWPRLVNLSEDSNATFNGSAVRDYFGFSLATGDINNDSIKDLVIGAPGMNVSGVEQVGMGYVFFGAQDFRSQQLVNANITFVGEQVINGINNTFALTGFALFMSKDVNNDSINDLIIGAPRSNAPPDKEDAGATHIIFGSNTISGTINLANANVTLYGTFGNPSGMPPGERAGASLYASDKNKDRIPDIMIGAPKAHANALSEAGIVYIVYGRTTWPRFMNLTSSDHTICGEAEGQALGFSVGSGERQSGGPSTNTITSTSVNPTGISCTNVRTFGFVCSAGAGIAADEEPPCSDESGAVECSNNADCSTYGENYTCDLSLCTCQAPPPPTPPTYITGGGPCVHSYYCDNVGEENAVARFTREGEVYLNNECNAWENVAGDPCEDPSGPKPTQDELDAAWNECCCKQKYTCEGYGETRGIHFTEPYYGQGLCKEPEETIPVVQRCGKEGVTQKTKEEAIAECCTCGDNLVEVYRGEQCDPPHTSCEFEKIEGQPDSQFGDSKGVCDYDCKCGYCGDGRVQTGDPWNEYCDDGPLFPGEACLAGTNPITNQPMGNLCGQDEMPCHCYQEEWTCVKVAKDKWKSGMYKVQARDNTATHRYYDCTQFGVAEALADGATQDFVNDCCLLPCVTDAECPSPPYPNNECWEPGLGCCRKTDEQGNLLLPEMWKCGFKEKDGVCQIGLPDKGAVYKKTADPECKPAAPTPQSFFNQKYTVPNACKVTLFGITLYSFGVNCQKNCTYGCPPCPPPSVGIPPDCECPPGTVGVPPDCTC